MGTFNYEWISPHLITAEEARKNVELIESKEILELCRIIREESEKGIYSVKVDLMQPDEVKAIQNLGFFVEIVKVRYDSYHLITWKTK